MTGNFDDWSKSLPPLAIAEDGVHLSTEIRVPERQKLVFKFVVDDSDWVLSSNYPQENDENGIANNYIAAADLVKVHPFEKEPSAVAEKADVDGEKTDLGVENSAFEVKELEHVPKIPESAPRVKSDEKPARNDFSEEVSGSPSSDIVKDHKDAKNDISAYENLTQTSTADSSFAAVSIPGSSDYEDIPKGPHEEVPGTPYEEEDFSTPTNSLFNLTVLSGNQTAATGTPAATQKAAESSTANTSLHGDEKKKTGSVPVGHESLETVQAPADAFAGYEQTFKVPGGFPSPDRKPTGSSRTPPNSHNVDGGSGVGGDGSQNPGKRDNLISRFKGLFRN